MYCKQCGAGIPDDGKFCPKCGASCRDDGGTAEQKKENAAASQEQGQKSGRSKTGSPKGKIIAIAIIAVVLLAGGIYLALPGGNRKAVYAYTDAKSGVWPVEGGEVVLDMSGRSEEVEDTIYDVALSADKKTAIYITWKDELYYVRHDLKPVSIADNVSEAYISMDGSFVTYRVEDAIFVYDIKKAK